MSFISSEPSHLFGYERAEVGPDGVTDKILVLPGGRIVGRVVDLGGKPLTGVAISAVRIQVPDSSPSSPPFIYTVPSTTKSTWDGRFTIFGLRAGSYTVSATMSDLGMAQVEGVEVPPEGDSAQVLLQVKEEQGATIVSSVVDLATGAPVNGSWARIYSRSPQGAADVIKQHNGVGVAEINGILPGKYIFYVGANNYGQINRPVELQAGQTLKFEDAIYLGGTLKWRLMNRSGQPLGGVQCRLTPNDANSIERSCESGTNPNGLYSETGLFPGDYTGTATFPDGSTLTETFTVVAGQSTDKTTVRR